MIINKYKGKKTITITINNIFNNLSINNKKSNINSKILTKNKKTLLISQIKIDPINYKYKIK